MVFKLLFDLIFGAVDLIVGLIPAFPSFSGLNVTLQPIFYIVDFVNLFVDIPMAARCLLLLLVVYNARFIWSILVWLVKKIPGVS